MADSASGSPAAGFVDRFARRAVVGQLKSLKRGKLLLEEAGGLTPLGQMSDLHAVLEIHNPRFFRHAMLGGTLSVAESYIQGDWDCDDLASLFRIFLRNRETTQQLDSPWTRLVGYGHRLFHWWHTNTPQGSRRNIGAHYDLGNDFFALWLDETMTYSSGIFPTPESTMAEASIEKLDRVCRALDLGPHDRVLEIGTGWGSFALHAARHYGCHVTTTTISQRQAEVARRRIAAAGLEDQITLVEKDYRDLRGRFDKLVSIEMIEAVGHRYLDDYFGQLGRLLEPDGSVVLQAIVMPDREHARYLRSVDFIQRYVFPGGCLPSLGSLIDSASRTTDLRLVEVRDYAPHYAETLRRWREQFHQRRDEVLRLGYSPQFLRLWNYYLCYCEAAFEERYIGVVQVRFDKPECRRDWRQDAKVPVERSYGPDPIAPSVHPQLVGAI